MSRPSGDEPAAMHVAAADDHETRRRAAAAGRTAERLVGALLDKVEGVSLWALEQTAESRPESDTVRSAEERLHRVRRLTSSFPRTTNRFIAGSTYFGFRFAPEAVRAAREILRETSAFLNAEPTSPEADTRLETPEA